MEDKLTEYVCMQYQPISSHRCVYMHCVNKMTVCVREGEREREREREREGREGGIVI